MSIPMLRYTANWRLITAPLFWRASMYAVYSGISTASAKHEPDAAASTESRCAWHPP